MIQGTPTGFFWDGKLRGFLVSGRVWTFSCTVCVDQQPEWDDTEDLDLEDIARGKNENQIMKKSRIYVPLAKHFFDY